MQLSRNDLIAIVEMKKSLENEGIGGLPLDLYNENELIERITKELDNMQSLLCKFCKSYILDGQEYGILDGDVYCSTRCASLAKKNVEIEEKLHLRKKIDALKMEIEKTPRELRGSLYKKVSELNQVIFQKNDHGWISTKEFNELGQYKKELDKLSDIVRGKIHSSLL